MTNLQRIVAPTSVEPACPAASLISEATGGSGCVCRITNSLVDAAENQSTLARYCFHPIGYQTCPVWRADKEEAWASKSIRPLLNSRGDKTSGHPEDRERDEGLERALVAREREEWTMERERAS
jgi:hypothetical protein